MPSHVTFKDLKSAIYATRAQVMTSTEPYLSLKKAPYLYVYFLLQCGVTWPGVDGKKAEEISEKRKNQEKKSENSKFSAAHNATIHYSVSVTIHPPFSPSFFG